MALHAEEEGHIGEEEDHHHEADRMQVHEEEDTVREEACAALPHQAGTATDVVDGLRMACQWAVVFLLQDITTISSTTRDHLLVSRRHMAEVRRLVPCHPCPLVKRLRWIIAQAHLQAITG